MAAEPKSAAPEGNPMLFFSSPDKWVVLQISSLFSAFVKGTIVKIKSTCALKNSGILFAQGSLG